MSTKLTFSSVAIVRLQGGSSICSGRVEIFHNRVWGTVCDNGWDTVDAAVVCKQRGCGKPKTVYSNAAVYGSGSGQIWMDGLSCTGREDSVEECTFSGWGVVSCTHTDDAGVICAGESDDRRKMANSEVLI